MTEKLLVDDSLRDNVKRITENVHKALQRVARKDTVRIMAVTKTIEVDLIRAAVGCGIDLLGENRVQEFLGKCGDYPKCEVHFIGGLQTNKVRQIVDKVTMIHSVDSYKLAVEIDSRAGGIGRVTDVLAEVNVAAEESKHGVTPEALDELVGQIRELKNVRLRGLMAIPPFGNSGRYFAEMQRLFGKYKDFDTLSMGMSGDYEEAIEYGATIVRLGSVLFGGRRY